MKYFIIGVHKSGTQSLENYLRAQGHDVKREETAFLLKDTPKRLEEDYPDYQPIIITREAAIRAYSDWYYFNSFTNDKIPMANRKRIHSFKDAVIEYPEILEASCYEKHAKRYKNLQVVKLEELSLESTFPWRNKADKHRMPFTESLRDFTLAAIEEAKQSTWASEV